MSNSLFESNDSGNITIDILVEDTYHPNTIMSNVYGNKLECPTFYGLEPIKGTIQILLNNSKKINHSGIKIELIGQIDIHINDNNEENNINNNNNQFNRFLSLTNNISNQGVLNKEINLYNFEFKGVEKQYDSYRGKKFSIKYILLVTVNIGISSITKEKEICIFNCDKILKKINKLFKNDDKDNIIKVEIGVENLLHVCFELDRKNYHLKDVVSGKISFKKINLELENMSLKIIKIESLFGKEGDIEPLGIYEIMDGSPSSTEDIIYFKMYLKGYNNLSQTIKNEMNNNINVSYYISLEICDTENRNFFKKIEINLFRLPEEYYNKIRQNIIEGKKDLYEYEDNYDNIDNNNKKNNNKNIKNKKIKNLFANVKNPLEENININENDNDNSDKEDNDNIKENGYKNKININEDEEIENEEIKKKQNKKKISSLFNSDFD